jgi:hypothetical protein
MKVFVRNYSAGKDASNSFSATKSECFRIATGKTAGTEAKAN